MKKIAWLIPKITKGSGGHRTIIQNVNLLIDNGYICDIYVKNDVEFDNEELKRQINEYYMPCTANVYKDWKSDEKYDVVFATSWDTVEPAKRFISKEKFYFIQDFEPCFFPMSDNYLFAENTYKEDFKAITIGKWLSYKLDKEYGMQTSYFDFCADLSIYKKEKVEKENAICCIFQPNKPRRCTRLLLKTIKIINELNPEIKIYLYGSEKKEIKGVNVKNLGIISPKELNDLYNKCKVGVSMSSSNPSRIPFEMMASGLPVVDLYRENNLYDISDKCAKLSFSRPEDLAFTILNLYDDEAERMKLSENGSRYMKNYPIEYGYSQFIEAFKSLLDNKHIKNEIKVLYKKKPKRAKKNMENILLNVGEEILDPVSEVIKYLEEDNKNLKRLLEESNSEINNILNSKRWKMANLLFKPMDLFKRKK